MSRRPSASARKSPTPAKPSLSERERRFVEAYLGDAKGNGTKAAIDAGYSPKTARIQASQLLARLSIKAAIDARTSKTMGPSEWLERVATLARFDIRKIHDPITGALKPIKDLGDDIAPCIAGIKVARERTTKFGVTGAQVATVTEQLLEVKSIDPLRALELLGRNLGLVKDKVEHEAGESLLALLTALGGPK